MTLEIEFSNAEAMRAFASWLSGSGEQAYWQWMEAREERTAGPITATSFDYELLESGVIGTTCGRLDER